MVTKDAAEIIEDLILKSCKEFFRAELPDKDIPSGIDPAIQVSKESSFGDISSTVAMKLASSAKKAPAEIASGVSDIISKRLTAGEAGDIIEKVTAVKGFINITLSREYHLSQLKSIVSEGPDYGRSDKGNSERVNIEFVSANPTGPLTIAHGRQAALGDALARMMRFSGYDVTEEYYLNDMGRQIKMLGESLRARYSVLCGEPCEVPEDGYQGEYVNQIASQLQKEFGDRLLARNDQNDEQFRSYAVEKILSRIREDLGLFGVKFDRWTPQSDIETRGEVEDVLRELREKGHIYENEGAQWFASSNFGDDKDRVVVKSDSSYTYLAPDMAYHRDKYKRGYDRVIDLLGPDHHGYIKRMEAAVEALGYDRASLNILIVQLVSLLRKGRKVSMSTRRGEFVSLREVLDEVGKDVARYYFLSRRLDTHLEFDIDLAKEECKENPVFYIQYAHARICSIKKYSKKGMLKRFLVRTDLKELSSDEEQKLIRHLIEFPLVVLSCVDALEPNRMVNYLNDLARLFHSFYTECRVVGESAKKSKARLFLVDCVKIVLSNGLGLLNISLPENM